MGTTYDVDIEVDSGANVFTEEVDPMPVPTFWQDQVGAAAAVSAIVDALNSHGGIDGATGTAGSRWFIDVPWDSGGIQGFKVEFASAPFGGGPWVNSGEGSCGFAGCVVEGWALFTAVRPTTTTTTSQPTTTTTTLPAECVTGAVCDDADPCTDDACVGGQCQQTHNAAPCDDGSVCTTGDVCGNGVCRAGIRLDVAAVAGFLTGATKAPSACTADKKDKKRVRKVLKQMKAAREKLLNAAQATEAAKRDRQIAKANAKLAKASGRLGKLAPRLSAACHTAMADRVGQAQTQAGCL